MDSKELVAPHRTDGVIVARSHLVSLHRSYNRIDARLAGWLIRLWITLRLSLPFVRTGAISLHTDCEQKTSTLLFESMNLFNRQILFRAVT